MSNWILGYSINGEQAGGGGGNGGDGGDGGWFSLSIKKVVIWEEDDCVLVYEE